MPTIIHYNGSKFAGEPADPIERLLQRLENHPLERQFERCGGFSEARGAPGNVRFFGNFHTLSAAFRIDSDDPDVVAKLTAAIETNMLRSDYQAQPAPFRPDLVRLERKRFSTTQGEVEVFYDSVRIGQFGDSITLQDGEWQGLPDRTWIDVAYSWFTRGEAAPPTLT